MDAKLSSLAVRSDMPLHMMTICSLQTFKIRKCEDACTKDIVKLNFIMVTALEYYVNTLWRSMKQILIEMQHICCKIAEKLSI